MQRGSQQRPSSHSHAFRRSVDLRVHSKGYHASFKRHDRRPRRLIALAAGTEVATNTPGAVSSTAERVVATSSAQADTYFPSRLPPTEYKNTRCICIKEDVGLWVLQQDFPTAGSASINLNCVVAKLANGNLLVSATSCWDTAVNWP